MPKVRGFRSLIFKYYDTEADFASQIGWARQKLNKITNGQKIPSIDELSLFAPYLHTTTGELADIFLSQKSPFEQLQSQQTTPTQSDG